ncbi:MAG: hypothetical protein LBP65_02945 [Puniceicoccales bacterium]|nr:hypothetical protein [Puniceicoccales bacterium]
MSIPVNRLVCPGPQSVSPKPEIPAGSGQGVTPTDTLKTNQTISQQWPLSPKIIQKLEDREDLWARRIGDGGDEVFKSRQLEHRQDAQRDLNSIGDFCKQVIKHEDWLMGYVNKNCTSPMIGAVKKFFLDLKAVRDGQSDDLLKTCGSNWKALLLCAYCLKCVRAYVSGNPVEIDIRDFAGSLDNTLMGLGVLNPPVNFTEIKKEIRCGDIIDQFKRKETLGRWILSETMKLKISKFPVGLRPQKEKEAQEGLDCLVKFISEVRSNMEAFQGVFAKLDHLTEERHNDLTSANHSNDLFMACMKNVNVLFAIAYFLANVTFNRDQTKVEEFVNEIERALKSLNPDDPMQLNEVASARHWGKIRFNFLKT